MRNWTRRCFCQPARACALYRGAPHPEVLEYLGIAVKARMLQAQCFLAGGDPAAARALLLQPSEYVGRVTVADLYPAEAHWITYQGFGAGPCRSLELQLIFDGSN
jgi:hypothetical protein